ncbi:MAG: type IV secretion system DNA-binding domain-containing protein, partial [Patescibacteria group bacterium]|nr:type IV secretion system DNA-binding domain-containing protein [Patescibacteria group bacterium]
RRRHIYVVGKTGMGKTTLLENMLFADIMAGHGCCLVDPHGDSAEKVLDFIPSNRINDVIYFNPADVENPIGFNILEVTNPEHKHLVAAGLMGVFKKIWPDVWSARMEYILNNAILALLDYPGSTLMGINRLMIDKEYRKKVIAKIKDPVVKDFWSKEYVGWQDRFRNEAIAPIQNKVGQFLSASVIRNIVSQVKSSINLREIMDNNKILIVNLSKGRIGEDNMRLLGGMLITKIQLAAMERIEISEEKRKDFYLFVDEFQNFVNPSFAAILSEARKYRLNLFVAHQYIEQLVADGDSTVRDAVFGNVGTLICFRIGGQDAEFLEKEFTPTFEIEDFVNLTKFDIYLKLMIEGVASNPFSATTLPPLHERQGNEEKVIKVSRERYSEKREVIEDKILRWSGVTEESSDEALPRSKTPERRGLPPKYTTRSSYSERPKRRYEPRPYKPSGIKSGKLVTKESEEEEISLDALKDRRDR